MLHERVTVLLAAAGAPWEVDAVRRLSGGRTDVVLLKRCVDLPDLLASAATGQARVAVVGDRLPGLDLDSLDSLSAAGVALVVVGPAPAPVLDAAAEAVAPSRVLELPDVVVRAASAAPTGAAEAVRPEAWGRHALALEEPAPSTAGRVVAVWGPAGAPGRTTVAVGLAAAAAHRTETFLVDADPYGGAVAQHLGVLDELSGLLGAARLANAGGLDGVQLAATARAVGPGLRVLTGLPRGDRWPEVRESAFDTILEQAAHLCPLVVLDLGFCLEEGETGTGFGPSGPRRNQMTLAGLERADEVVVVGSADPVGLSRLARGLVDLLAVAPATTLRVVVNHVRPSIGWSQGEVRAMVEGFVTPAGVHFLPYDRDAVDRALMEGRAVGELSGSTLGRALDGLARAVDGSRPEAVPARRAAGMLRLRTAGRAR